MESIARLLIIGNITKTWFKCISSLPWEPHREMALLLQCLPLTSFQLAQRIGSLRLPWYRASTSFHLSACDPAELKWHLWRYVSPSPALGPSRGLSCGTCSGEFNTSDWGAMCCSGIHAVRKPWKLSGWEIPVKLMCLLEKRAVILILHLMCLSYIYTYIYK